MLWRAQKPGEPAWESPWGAGRPGWHIECSTIITKWLGETIDIHGGGADLTFPHHECGIAQVEPVTGKPFVRTWMHTAMVRYQGEKMSKSLGNLIMVRDLLKTYSPDVIRLYLAAHHYRSSWSHDERKLEQAQTLAKHLLDIVMLPSGQTPPTAEMKESYALDEKNFHAAMNNDLDTPKALSAIEDLAIDVKYDALAGYDVQEAMSTLRAFCRVFGLQLDAGEPEPRVVAGWNRHLERFRMSED